MLGGPWLLLACPESPACCEAGQGAVRGQVPDDRDAVFGLKGVGPYTAGAILSIAFNRPEPAVDGNVMRVLSRYFLIEDDIAKGPTRVKMEKLAAELIPEGEAGSFNQALMELGALICTPKSPRCLPCPVMEHCAARLVGCEASLPVKTKAKPPRPEERLAALVEGRGEHAGRVLIRQRPASGLLARMWELPHWPAPPAEAGGARGALLPEAAALDRLRRSMSQAGIHARPEGHWMAAEHTFSHIVWTLQVYRCKEEAALPLAAESRAVYGAAQAERGGRPLGGADGPLSAEAGAVLAALGAQPAEDAPLALFDSGDAAADAADSGAQRWINREDMKNYAFPNVFLKLLNSYFDEQGT